MGFRFRKSKKAGPLLFTFTHRGPSVSVGGGGFRYHLLGGGRRHGKGKAASGGCLSTLATLFVLFFGTAAGIGYLSGGGSDTAVTPSTLAELSTPPIAPPASPRTTPQTSANVAPAIVVAEPALPPNRLRTWTDSTGRHKTEAELLEAWGGVAYLVRDGKTRAVPLNRLSADDQTYVREEFPVQVISGTVFGLTDGDTITVVDASKAQWKIRLEGIDAPEKKQAYGTQSSKALGELVFRKPVTVEWREKDKYGRTLGHVFVDELWVNHEQVATGWAWHYKKFNQNGILAATEDAARQARLGLWAGDDPFPPWEFRDKPAEPRPPPRAPIVNTLAPQRTEVTVYVTDTGDKYHRAGCRSLHASSHPMALSRAASTYEPCKVCHPPMP